MAFILVDEYQDVNSIQVELMDLLLEPDTQLFCVGDDWQSIYGFRGSEVEHIVKFKDRYNNASILPFTRNYRSTGTIVSASNALIANNKQRLNKPVRSSGQQGKRIQVYAAIKEHEDGVSMVVDTVQRLLDSGTEADDILILYRRTSCWKPYAEAFKSEGVRIRASTVHGAKGLEAAVVIIIGLTKDYFPNVWEGDRIFQVVKQDNIAHLLEEERRLFYVAVTRAKEQLYLVTEVGNESQFIAEMHESHLERGNFVTLNYRSDQLICTGCQASIEAFFKFCPHCGERPTAPTTPASNEPEYITNARKEHPRAYERWSTEEDEQLLSFFKEGLNAKEIAQKLERQPSAIESRMKKLV